MIEFEETGFDGLVIVKPTIFEDSRGYFVESFNQNEFLKSGFDYSWVQDDESFSLKGTIRGLHFQCGDMAQAKMVRVVKGEIFDVVLDLRRNSRTFGKTFSIRLNDKNKLQMLIPRGFAHGFSVLSESALVHYKVDNFYDKDSERGVYLFDEHLDINWYVDECNRIVSDKDKALPKFNESNKDYF